MIHHSRFFCAEYSFFIIGYSLKMQLTCRRVDQYAAAINIGNLVIMVMWLVSVVCRPKCRHRWKASPFRLHKLSVVSAVLFCLQGSSFSINSWLSKIMMLLNYRGVNIFHILTNILINSHEQGLISSSNLSLGISVSWFDSLINLGEYLSYSSNSEDCLLIIIIIFIIIFIFFLQIFCWPISPTVAVTSGSMYMYAIT